MLNLWILVPQCYLLRLRTTNPLPTRYNVPSAIFVVLVRCISLWPLKGFRLKPQEIYMKEKSSSLLHQERGHSLLSIGHYLLLKRKHAEATLSAPREKKEKPCFLKNIRSSIVLLKHVNMVYYFKGITVACHAIMFYETLAQYIEQFTPKFSALFQ